jgi:hypothetical protein
MSRGTILLLRGLPLLGWSIAVVVLALVFLAYFSPEMAITLSNFVWSCFGG